MSAAPRNRRAQPCTTDGCNAYVTDQARHLRDTGDTVRCPDDACSVLFAKRNRLDMTDRCTACCLDLDDCDCECEPSQAAIDAFVARNPNQFQLLTGGTR